jgi:RimJ/RimL family protein N-acetyltransferase
MNVPTLVTARLILREQRPSDTDALIRAYSDAAFAHFITTQRRALTAEEAWRAVAVVAGGWSTNGFSQWAVEERTTGALIGRVGPWTAPGWPAVEVGWSIIPQHQGKGYATEAAVAAIVWAHDQLGKDELIHLIDPSNTPSEAVARKLGATITGSHSFSEDVIANIWTSRWETFAASAPYQRYVAALDATA